MKPALLFLSAVAVVSPALAATRPPDGARYFDDRRAADRAHAEQRNAAAESLYARIAESGEDVWVWLRLGQSRVRLERYREAAEAFRRALSLGTRRSAEGSPTFMQQRIARCYALAGERDSALAWLERAIAGGHEDRASLGEDDAFASLRGDPRFERLLGRTGAGLGRDAGWRHDLDTMISEIRRVHVRYRDQALPSGFEAAARALHGEIPRLRDAEVFLRLQALMARIGDEFLPKENYYRKFDIQLDHRGKVKGIVENPYDRAG